MLLLGASGSFSKKQFCGGKNLIKKKKCKSRSKWWDPQKANVKVSKKKTKNVIVDKAQQIAKPN